jgi:hypothetical protein
LCIFDRGEKTRDIVLDNFWYASGVRGGDRLTEEERVEQY